MSADFVRARSKEHKKTRLEEIKEVTDKLFSTRSYHEISLTAIAEMLGYSRANIYKYVSSKEEIFLALTEDKANDYMNALTTIFRPQAHFSLETVAEIWAGLAVAHRDYFRYGEIFPNIVSTNVSVEKLARFKASFFKRIEGVKEALACTLDITPEEAYDLYLTVYYYAIGLNSDCQKSEAVQKALEMAKLEVLEYDFQQKMRDFIYMCVYFHTRKGEK